MSPTGKDPLQKRLEIQNWIVLGVLTLISFALVSVDFAMGVLCGGLISIANFYWLYRSVKKAFLQFPEKTKSFIMIRYYLRFVLSGIILYLLITRTTFSVIGLLIGLSVVVINIVFTTVVEVSKKNLTLKTKEVE